MSTKELETRCNELFFQVNEKTERIADLEKENADLKEEINKIAFARGELEEENAELKKLKRECETSLCRAEYQYNYEQLTKAKELLKKYVIWCGTATPIKSPLQIEVEQFLKETEK